MAGIFRCAVDGDFGSGNSGGPSATGLSLAGFIGTAGFATPGDIAAVMAAEGFENLDWCGYGVVHGGSAFHLSLDLAGAAQPPAVSLSFDLSAGAGEAVFMDGALAGSPGDGFGQDEAPATREAVEAGALPGDGVGRSVARRALTQREPGRFALRRRADRRGREPAHRRPG